MTATAVSYSWSSRSAPDGRRVEHRVERPGQAAGTAGQEDGARPLAARAAEDLPVQVHLLGGHLVRGQNGKAHRRYLPTVARACTPDRSGLMIFMCWACYGGPGCLR